MAIHLIPVIFHVMDGSRQRIKPDIMLALGSYDHRMHRGVLRYAHEANWRLYWTTSNNQNVPYGWRGDGIITNVMGNGEFSNFIRNAGVPVIDMSWRCPELQVPRVLCDHQAIAQMAAEHFLHRGFRRFVFLAGSDNWTSKELHAAFGAHLTTQGHSYDFFDFKRQPDETWLDRQQRLESFLADRIGPVAVSRRSISGDRMYFSVLSFPTRCLLCV